MWLVSCCDYWPLSPDENDGKSNAILDLQIMTLSPTLVPPPVGNQSPSVGDLNPGALTKLSYRYIYK